MGKNFTKKYEIHYYEVNSKMRCKLPAIINFLEDIGTQQSEQLGVGIDYCLKKTRRALALLVIK